MCGRYSLAVPAAELEAELGVAGAPADLPRRYNIAPSQDVPIVRMSGGRARWDTARWGLIPAWAKEPSVGHRMINARAESVRERAAFRDAFERRRCLVPADGFFEWQRRSGRAWPYRIRRADGRPFAFAGLWERWRSRGGEDVRSCAILTTLPNAIVRPLHDRMPVILTGDACARWLDGSSADPALDGLLAPCDDTLLEAYPVSPLVNDPANDRPECIARAEEGDTGDPQTSLLFG